MTGIKEKSKGFTLIELIVVMAVFLLVIGTAMGIFISIVKQQKRILAEQELLNQASYVMEYMSKAIRMAEKDDAGGCLTEGVVSYPGYTYLLTRADPGGFYRGIKFINQSDNNACQEFYLDNAVQGDTSTPLVLKEIKNGVPIEGALLTSEKFNIEALRFGINGHDGCYGEPVKCPQTEGGNNQPRITILLNIRMDAQSVKKFQTTVSQRNLNTQ